MARIDFHSVPEGSRWTILGEAKTGKHYKRYAHVRCLCGTEAVRAWTSITSGHSKSCGCHNREAARKTPTTHGMKRTREYNIWCKVKSRCSRPKDSAYGYYGALGVAMHPEWVESFEAFYAYLGPCPRGYSIDRIDPHGSYVPGNVRWASNMTQARNKRKIRDLPRYVYAAPGGKFEVKLSKKVRLGNFNKLEAIWKAMNHMP